jgi:5-methylcytosine-specific restriction endonuclease McrA
MKRKRKKKVSYSLSALRLRAFYDQNEKCYWCGKQMLRVTKDNNPLKLTGDHLIPLYAGGKTRPGNIVAACLGCNSTRNSAETNRRSHRVHDKIAMWGDPTGYSPFEVLKGKIK